MRGLNTSIYSVKSSALKCGLNTSIYSVKSSALKSNLYDIFLINKSVLLSDIIYVWAFWKLDIVHEIHCMWFKYENEIHVQKI